MKWYKSPASVSFSITFLSVAMSIYSLLVSEIVSSTIICDVFTDYFQTGIGINMKFFATFWIMIQECCMASRFTIY